MVKWDKNRILFLDNDLIVVRKPAGVPVQTKNLGQTDMEHILLNELASSEKTVPGKQPYLAVVHRLDQPVEGILVFARSEKAAASLSRQLTDGTMKKQYLAVTSVVPQQKEGTLIHYLVRNGKTNSSYPAAKGSPGAKLAKLNYKVLEEKNSLALAEVNLLTGRHHQIRVQLAAAGMPILGDRKYGRTEDKTIPFPALCAWKLTFKHPINGKNMEFTAAPEGEAFRIFEQQLSKQEIIK